MHYSSILVIIVLLLPTIIQAMEEKIPDLTEYEKIFESFRDHTKKFECCGIVPSLGKSLIDMEAEMLNTAYSKQALTADKKNKNHMLGELFCQIINNRRYGKIYHHIRYHIAILVASGFDPSSPWVNYGEPQYLLNLAVKLDDITLVAFLAKHGTCKLMRFPYQPWVFEEKISSKMRKVLDEYKVTINV